MPKVGMEPIRRRQLIAATIEAIHQAGFGQTTVAEVSRRAGLSSGIVAHYFQEAEDLRCGVVAHQAKATGAEARVLAVIDANFAPELFTPPVVTAWLAFWSQVGQAPGLARIQQVYERRLRSNLLAPLKQLLPAAEAEQLTEGLAALIDGLWLRCALTNGALDPAAARRLARDYLGATLASYKTEK
jgi:TetR/AcrR family transcriptional repressor of bet genes